MAQPPEDPRNSPCLLACAREGDATAWEELVCRYNRLVRSTVASFRLREDDAAEAVQTTWLRLLERIDRIRDPERLGGWLATTARRECLALIRRRHREASGEGASKQPVTAEEPVTVIAGQASTADVARAESTRRRDILIQYLLYEPERLYYGTARAADVPQGSVEPTRARALRQLRGMLQQRGDRTGSYVLDDLLDKADQALQDRLEHTLTDLRTDGTHGTGDAQLDDLLQKADAALRIAVHERKTTDPATEGGNRADTPLMSDSSTRPHSADRPAAVHDDITGELWLTPQELAVALAVLRGLNNVDVAADLWLSVKTVEYHLSNIYRKLGVSSRTQLIHVLAEHGYKFAM